MLVTEYPDCTRTVIGYAADELLTNPGRITEIGQAMKPLVAEHGAYLLIEAAVLQHGYLANANRSGTVPYFDIYFAFVHRFYQGSSEMLLLIRSTRNGGCQKQAMITSASRRN